MFDVLFPGLTRELDHAERAVIKSRAELGHRLQAVRNGAQAALHSPWMLLAGFGSGVLLHDRLTMKRPSGGTRGRFGHILHVVLLFAGRKVLSWVLSRAIGPTPDSQSDHTDHTVSPS